MTPIVTYREATLFGKRKYELLVDKIVIRGSAPGSYEFEQINDLSKINPAYIRIRIRPNVAWLSLAISLLSGLLSVILVKEFAIRSAAVPGVLGIFSVSALVVALATMRRIEYARFCSDGYGSVLLNVARSGPDQDRFDGFVQALVAQVEAAKKSDHTPRHDPNC